MVTDEKDFELLGDPANMTGYSRPPENKLTAVTRVLGIFTAVALLLMTITGVHNGMLSPYSSEFTAIKNSTTSLTLNEASWAVSFIGVGRILGAILGSISVQYVGFKKTMLINSLILLLSWVSLIYTNSAISISVDNFLRGTGTGISYVCFPVYLGEVGDPNIRGTLVFYAMSGLPLGSMLGTLLGTYISMLLVACVGLVLSCACISIYLYVPESPHFLVRAGQMEDAKRSIRRYNPNLDVKVELNSIKNFVTESSSLTFADRLRELKTPRDTKTFTSF